MAQDDAKHKSIDSLSKIGRKLLQLDAADAYRRLVVNSPGNEAARTMLESLSPGELIEGKITSEDDARAVGPEVAEDAEVEAHASAMVRGIRVADIRA